MLPFQIGLNRFRQWFEISIERKWTCGLVKIDQYNPASFPPQVLNSASDPWNTIGAASGRGQDVHRATLFDRIERERLRMLDKYDRADSGALDLRRVYAIAMKMQ
jgi:hypothetical protein